MQSGVRLLVPRLAACLHTRRGGAVPSSHHKVGHLFYFREKEPKEEDRRDERKREEGKEPEDGLI